MTINPSSSSVSVDDEATLIIDDESTPKGAKEDGRITYHLYNAGPDDVFLGDAGVSVEDGAPLPVDAAFSVSIRHQGKLYAICDTGGTADVRVMVIP